MTYSNLKIREACADDAPAIKLLYMELVGGTMIQVLPDQIAALATDPNSNLMVCELHGQVCATALVSICPDVMFGTQPYAIIENIIVTRSIQGQGIGQQLMLRIEGYCLERDCSKMMMLSSVARVSAHEFFENSGFNGDTKRGFVKYRRQFDIVK